MMRLYLLRHAEAVPHGTPDYADDAERPLTDAGREQARAVAKGLKRLKLPIELIATSPYVRAAQTAEHLAEVLGGTVPMKTLQELRAEIDPAEASLALKPFADYDHVVCVGHEPHLSGWTAKLCAASGQMQCVVKKAGVVCVELADVPPLHGSGTLRWLMTPKQLMLIGKA